MVVLHSFGLRNLVMLGSNPESDGFFLIKTKCANNLSCVEDNDFEVESILRYETVTIKIS